MTRALLLLAASFAAPLAAQTPATQAQVSSIDRRVGSLESQMRAVQRRVFPGGDRAVAPESAPPAEAAVPTPEPVGTPATAPLVDLTNRVVSLENQQRALTGQVEQLQFRQRQLEESLTKLRGDAEFRFNALESTGPRPAAEAPPAETAAATPPRPAPKPAPKPVVPSDPEAAYTAAYRLYTAGDYPAAETALTAFAKANPRHPRASNARFWAGRAMSAQNRHAAAAEVFLNNYKDLPRGERAPNSLLWLAKSLVSLNQPKTRAGACDVLDQLAAAFPDQLTGALKRDADATRTAAKCG